MKTFRGKRSIQSWTVRHIVEAVESGELDLETEYQRDPIWSKEQKVRLIDSILQDIDIPKIYLAEFSREKRFECIDGKQRINCIIDFFNDRLSLESGLVFSKLNSRDRNNFLDYLFTV